MEMSLRPLQKEWVGKDGACRVEKTSSCFFVHIEESRPLLASFFIAEKKKMFYGPSIWKRVGGNLAYFVFVSSGIIAQLSLMMMSVKTRSGKLPCLEASRRRKKKKKDFLILRKKRCGLVSKHLSTPSRYVLKCGLHKHSLLELLKLCDFVFPFSF